MEIDTGASVLVIGKKTFESLQKGVNSTINFKTYTGESIAVLESVLVPVEYSGQTLHLPLIVTQVEGSPLLGRDWLVALRLDWKTIYTVSTMLSLQQILDKYNRVFKEGLG